MPKNHRLRERIIRDHHNNPLAGHPGCYKTQELIQRNYWWPQMQKMICWYVDGCIKCQEDKINQQPLHAPLNPHDIPKQPWQKVTADMIGPLPESNGFNAIEVFTDTYSHCIHVEPSHIELSAEGFANLVRDRVIPYHGLPEILISDRGPQTVAKAWGQICKQLGITQHLSTGYHLETDGQTERPNQEVEAYLQLFTNYLQDNWSEWCTVMEFSYNNRVHSMTKQSPFFVDHGYHPYTGTELQRDQVPSATEWVNRLSKARQEAEAALALAKAAMKQQFNKHRSELRDYKPRDLVWLDVTISTL